MSNLESLFEKEFKANCRILGSKNIYSVPLPKEVESWYISGTEQFLIKDIEDEFYSKLNNTLVNKLPSNMEAKRRIIDPAKRSFKVDPEGNYVYEKVTIPSGSMVIISSCTIKMPYGYKPNEQGFDYIDFVLEEGDNSKVKYIYIIPKRYLFKVHQTALAISVKNMKNFQGMGYLTWDNGVIFVHIINYNPNSKYEGTKILKTSTTLNYSKEIKTLLEFWVKNQYIPYIDLCQMSNGENLALKPTVTGYEDYIPVDEFSLGEKEVYSEKNRRVQRMVDEYEEELRNKEFS